MKALIKLHFQHEARYFIENVLRSTLSYPNETSKECIQFLNEIYYVENIKSTNIRIHELVIFNQTTKINTQEEKYFHSTGMSKIVW
jgi:hypothetical protein